MQRVEVESKCLKSVSYDAATERLELEFATGRTYEYEAVPASVHAWLLKVKNRGKFVDRFLSRFRYREVLPAGSMTLDLEEALRASLEKKRGPLN